MRDPNNVARTKLTKLPQRKHPGAVFFCINRPFGKPVHGILCIMKHAPKEHEIWEWLLRANPLGLFAGDEDVTIRDIDPKPWSGHFNFLVFTGERKMVLRFKGPEWGTPGGVSEEFIILSKVEPFAVGPKVFFHADDFFGEPAVLMEYLSGVLATDIPTAEKTEMLWQDIAKFIVRINEIPFSEDSFPFREPMTDY